MTAAKGTALLGLLLIAAIFGFFYAWVCSTMWGLDQADPRVSIAAMQAMNASVRNGVFAPAFFGTPVVLALAAILSRNAPRYWFAAAAITYALFGAALTMAVNVPMNEALARVAAPQDLETARAVWQGYSADWQVWNQLRTVASGLALLMTGMGMMKLPR